MTSRTFRFSQICLFSILLLIQFTLAASAQNASNDSSAATTTPVNFSSVTTPEVGSIGSLAADSENDIWATAVLESMSLHFNGSTWGKVPMAKASRVNKVAVVSSNNVWAVGQQTDKLSQIQHFNGGLWEVISSPHFTAGENLNSLKAISANSIFAVGSVGGVTHRTPLVEHFNGSTWSVVPVPKIVGGELFDIAIISPTDIWAVGDTLGSSTGFPALAMHFNGVQWSRVPTPVLGGLFGITALSTNNVWAVGAQNQGPIIEHWNGIGWKLVPSPKISNLAFLNSISAISATDIWAGGCNQCSDAGGAPLVEHWNGTTWTVNPIPLVDHGVAVNTVLTFPSKHIFVGGFAFNVFQAATVVLEGKETQ
jgi:hypothetical protein